MLQQMCGRNEDRQSIARTRERTIRFLVFAAIAVICHGCAHQIEPIPDSRHPDDPGKEAALRCIERRGDEQFVPRREFRSDGCSLWPDSEWQSCCVEHDMVYWCGGSAAERKVADSALRSCIASTGHAAMGAIMSGAVRFTGAYLFPTPWRWGYGWSWLGKMQRKNVDESDVVNSEH
jgi:hypothetical protein